MKELKKQFRKKGTDFTQLYKDGNLAIYQLSRPYVEGNGHSVWYEVFRYKTAKTPKMWESDENEMEKYPSDEEFGVWAWSCSNVESVKKVLNAEFTMRESQITAFLDSIGLL